MQKPLRDYLSMTPAQILADPDAPESLKIKAQIEMENERRTGHAETDQKG